MKSLGKNVSAGFVQALFGILILFILYRYLNKELGVSAIGVWSVVLAVSSASRLADLGIGASVTRFVARELARSDASEAWMVLNTAFVTVLVLLAVAMPGFYFLFQGLLPLVFAGEELKLALVLLPYSMFSLGLAFVASIFQSGLDGCQRIDLRAMLVLLAQAIMVLSAFALVPGWGLIGLAWAQVFQGCLLLLGGWLLFCKEMGEYRLPVSWDMVVFRDMLGYGLKIQAAGVAMMFFDPVAKALMARFGGAEAAGYFEMANQLVLKMRQLIISANQAVIPKVAEMVERDREGIRLFYLRNVYLLALVAMPAYSLVAIWSGAVSVLLFDEVQEVFLYMMFLSLGGYFINVFSAPAYFVNMGTGHVGWNAWSHVLMGVFNAIGGWLLGEAMGWKGVMIAYALSLILGSLLLIAMYHLREHINIYRKVRWVREDARLFGSGAIAWGASWLVWSVGGDKEVGWLPWMSVGLFTLLVVVGLGRHPVVIEVTKGYLSSQARTD